MDKYIKEKIIYPFWNETIYKINSKKLSELLESSKNNKENIYETSNDFNNNKNNNLEFKYNSNNSSFSTNYSSITLLNTNYSNINKDFIIIDFRDKEEYNKLHIIQAINFPPINISRDKFPFDMVLMRNKPGKIIIMYYKESKKGIEYLNDCMNKGYDNNVLLDGGIENFREEYPEFLEGQEKGKYIKITKEKDEKKRNEWNFNFID